MEALDKQLNWMKDRPGYNIIVWDQDSPEGTAEKYPWATWKRVSVKSVGEARSEIFKDFFQTDEDWCSVWDNDVTILGHSYDRHLDGFHFFDALIPMLDSYTGLVGSIVPSNGANAGYTQAVSRTSSGEDGEWLASVNENWLVRPTFECGSVTFLCNLKKHWDIELYQHWDYMHEDWAWRGLLAMHGIPFGATSNFYLKDYTGTAKSSLFTDNVQRKNDYAEADAFFATTVFKDHSKRDTTNWNSLLKLVRGKLTKDCKEGLLKPKPKELILQKDSGVYGSLFGD